MHTLNNRSRRRLAWGFISLEISLGLIVAAVVGFYALRSTLRDSTINSAYIQADQIKKIRDGLSSYAKINATALVAGSAISGVSNILQPTVAELTALQMLPAGSSTLATLNRSPFVMRLTVSPSGCTLGSCVIDGYVYVRDPFLGKGDVASTGRYDGTIVGAILERLGGDGFARVAPNANLVSAAGSFNYTNSTNFAHPTITVNGQPYPAGVVGMRIQPFTPDGVAAAGSGVSGPCPGGSINTVEAAGTGGTGNGNQCFFTYPPVQLGSSATVLNTQTSTIGTLTVRCLAVNGSSTINIASLTCAKK
ncbi:hypothetical protein [Limnobacter sp.]|uniref:hypothetical protein n=1 Tax=Limnobacter sp. TaxID=2003368 RepID=UPI003514251C